MANKTELRARLDFWQEALKNLRAAYLSLLDGGVKYYRIDNRELTLFDLPELQEKIEEAEKKVDELTAALEGQKPRKAFAVMFCEHLHRSRLGIRFSQQNLLIEKW